MRKQQRVWQQEHQTSSTLPGLSEQDPSSAVIFFGDFLAGKVTPPGKVVDVGCGKGRNSFYFAKQGFEVYGMDFIQGALDICEDLAAQYNLFNKCHFYKENIDGIWPFPDNFFDIAIDCFSSIDIETKIGREMYKQELYRTLKPGGYALVAVVSSDDEWEKKLIKTSPGKEKNSTIWPQGGKFQKNYGEAELREFYKEFQIVELKKVTKKAHKLGKNYLATNFWLILQKASK